MKKGEQRVAKRYARAFFQSVPTEQIDQYWQALQTLAEVWQTSLELREVVANPVIPIRQRQDLLSALAEKALPAYQSQTLPRFLAVLVENDRIAALPDIALAFGNLVCAHKAIIQLEVTSAFELPHEEKALLQQELERSLQHGLNISWYVDPQIIGGLKIKAGDQLFDATVRGSLEQLRSNLLS